MVQRDKRHRQFAPYSGYTIVGTANIYTLLMGELPVPWTIDGSSSMVNYAFQRG
jgi:hypothetical protein